jgi:hypothetical protein
MASNVKPTGPQDAATQAGSGEARVIGSNQDQSATGAADAAPGLAKLKGNVANEPGPGPCARHWSA